MSSSDEENSSSNSSSDGDENPERELSNEEMEKLIQLQDLTGIEDLQICRALLESKDWDLEATAREHLNLPNSPPPPPSFEPRPLSEAPNARSVMRPGGVNHNSPPRGRPGGGLVPMGHTVFSWAMYLFTMPFRLTYRTVFGVFDLVLSIFGLSGTANSGIIFCFLTAPVTCFQMFLMTHVFCENWGKNSGFQTLHFDTEFLTGLNYTIL